MDAALVVLCRDCWCVAFGNSFSDEERCVLAGYDNGDVKLFDLRMNKVWGISISCEGVWVCACECGCGRICECEHRCGCEW